MQSLSFSLGTVFFVLFTIGRTLVDGQRVGLSNKSFKDVFGTPAKNDNNGILMATGQLMGILWIVVGFVLIKMKDWSGLGWGRLAIEFLLLASPFIIAQAVMWRLKKKQENKQ